MSAKDRAVEIYKQHIHLAAENGRLFRKTVMEQLKAETGCSQAAAATHYNNAKKLLPVEGLGRAPVSKNVRRQRGHETVPDVDDNDCFSVLELIPTEQGYDVGRCQSFILQGDASEKFDEKKSAWAGSTWVMIQGLGPISGETYRLEPGEREIRRYEPEQVAA